VFINKIELTTARGN